MFPLEIEETILDFLADDEGHSALKTCSLVCKAFLPICRKHIFETIVLEESNSGTTNASAFDRLLRETPEIADYIRKLDYNVGFKFPHLESLTRISRLKFLSVRLRLDWSNHPIRPALLHLLHLPTLTHFKATGIRGFVVSDLIPCVNLKYLDIGSYTYVAAEDTFPPTLPEHSIQLNEFLVGMGSPAAVMKLCTARRPDGQPIIDFESLSKITVIFDLEASQELFRRCHALTSVNVSIWYPRNVRLNLADMLRPSMQTLKHIVLDIRVDDVDDDPLFSISSEFEDMRTNNIIETITIEVMAASWRRGDMWGKLDEALTAPGWFLLKRVSLVVEIFDYNTSDLEVALPTGRTQFPRLSSSNSVSFNFKYNC